MTDTDKKILIILPSYNEEATLAGVIADVHKHNPGADILVVDDGSRDNTGAVALRHDVTLLTLPFNMGVGAAVQTGFKYALKHGYDIAVQVDADGQHPAEHIRDVVAPVAEGRADVCVGSRFLGTGDYKPSIARSAGIALFASIISIILRQKITDTTSGFRATGKENALCRGVNRFKLGM